MFIVNTEEEQISSFWFPHNHINHFNAKSQNKNKDINESTVALWLNSMLIVWNLKFIYGWFSFSSLSLFPQLFPEHLHQSADQWELQHVSSVCTDILICQPECDLSALPGPDLCTDWIQQLCACEYTPTCSDWISCWTVKEEINIFSSVTFVFFLGLSAKNSSCFTQHNRNSSGLLWASAEVRWRWALCC